MILRTGAIYSLTYTAWKRNRKIYAFILYGGAPKVHALNLGCRELGTVEQTKVAHVIARLSKVEATKKWDGATLYRIFRTYLPREISLCYRTYFLQYISQSALINYGFNTPESFGDLEQGQGNKLLYSAAGKDLFVQLLNSITNRGVQMEQVIKTFATVKPVPDNVIEHKNTPHDNIQTILKNKTSNTTTVTPNKNSNDVDGYY